MWEKIKVLFGWLFGTKDPDTSAGTTEEELAALRSRAEVAEMEADMLRGRLDAVLANAQQHEKQLLAIQAAVDGYFAQ